MHSPIASHPLRARLLSWLITITLVVATDLSAATNPVTPEVGKLPAKIQTATNLKNAPRNKTPSVAFSGYTPHRGDTSQPSLVKAATLIIHAKIDGIWEERTDFAIWRCFRFRTLKGKFDSKEVWVKVSHDGANPPSKSISSVAGLSPKKSDLRNNISLGKEFVLFLEPEPTASGTFRILRQGQEWGLAPYSKAYLDNVRKSIKGLDPKANETTATKKFSSEK